MINYPRNDIDSKSFRSSKKVLWESISEDREFHFVFEQWVGLAKKMMEDKERHY